MTTFYPNRTPEDTARVMKLHQAICRCPACKGSTDKAKLCGGCRLLDDMIDNYNAAGASVPAAE